MVIEGGQKANKLSVNDNNQAEVEAITIHNEENINRKTGKYWTIPFENIDPASDNDYFIYIKNTSNDKNYEITDIRIASTVVGQVELQVVTGTATGGTAVVAVPLKVATGVAPTATIESGTDITGLTNTGVMNFIQLDTVNKEQLQSYSGHRIIPPNQAVALLWEPSTGILTGTISLLETDVE